MISDCLLKLKKTFKKIDEIVKDKIEICEGKDGKNIKKTGSVERMERMVKILKKTVEK